MLTVDSSMKRVLVLLAQGGQMWREDRWPVAARYWISKPDAPSGELDEGLVSRLCRSGFLKAIAKRGNVRNASYVLTDAGKAAAEQKAPRKRSNYAGETNLSRLEMSTRDLSMFREA